MCTCEDSGACISNVTLEFRNPLMWVRTNVKCAGNSSVGMPDTKLLDNNENTPHGRVTVQLPLTTSTLVACGREGYTETMGLGRSRSNVPPIGGNVADTVGTTRYVLKVLCWEPDRTSLEPPALLASCHHSLARDMAGVVQEIQGTVLRDGDEMLQELIASHQS